MSPDQCREKQRWYRLQPEGPCLILFLGVGQGLFDVQKIIKLLTKKMNKENGVVCMGLLVKENLMCTLP